jgi:ribose-phosphate pyrophosphokinase
VSITAKLVSNLIDAAGADRVLTLDLHCDQIQGFFDIPLDHLSSEVVFVKYVRERSRNDLVVISPDPGSVKRARQIAERLDAPLAFVDKRRPKVNEAQVMRVIGDVAGKHALIFDDIIDTASTLVKSAHAVKELGAIDVVACATHAVFSGEALSNIEESVLDEVCVGDSIPISAEMEASKKIKVVSFAPLLAEAIRRIHEEESISILFT